MEWEWQVGSFVPRLRARLRRYGWTSSTLELQQEQAAGSLLANTCEEHHRLLIYAIRTSGCASVEEQRARRACGYCSFEAAAESERGRADAIRETAAGAVLYHCDEDRFTSSLLDDAESGSIWEGVHVDTAREQIYAHGGKRSGTRR